MEEVDDTDQDLEDETLLSQDKLQGANDHGADELHMSPASIQAVADSWNGFLLSLGSPDAAADAILAAVVNASPLFQGLFKSQDIAPRIMNALHQLVFALPDPQAMKVVVEVLAVQHLHFNVTVDTVASFSTALVHMFSEELGRPCTVTAEQGWHTCLAYVGNAMIAMRTQLGSRLDVLATSWARANHRPDSDSSVVQEADVQVAQAPPREGPDGKSKAPAVAPDEVPGGKRGRQNRLGAGNLDNLAAPSTFREMFLFHAAMRGFGAHGWMNEILACFDVIVRSVANTSRLQDECDFLSLRLVAYTDSIRLLDFRVVMLASLRSLLSTDWSAEHEVSWCWLWENVQRMLQAQMSKCEVQRLALDRLSQILDDTKRATLCQELYVKYFVLAPAGEDFFKQSTTRLHFIAASGIGLVFKLNKEPQGTVEEISAIGLRHVGYGVPTELFSPFVTAFAAALRTIVEDDAVLDAFRWSLSLISRILVRMVTEGSTAVTKAINANSVEKLRRALRSAPRGERTRWVLSIQVGSHSISPLMWAIEVGSLSVAKAIVEDLLTIRSDRERYYYGMTSLFEHHPDIIRKLTEDAPQLLPTLLDGLIWRSRATQGRLRRVNYYLKPLLMDAEGGFSDAIGCITKLQNPKVVCHPIVALVTDLLWEHIAFRSFVKHKCWYAANFVVFLFTQDVLKHWSRLHEEVDDEGRVHLVRDDQYDVRMVTFAFRCFIYVFNMGHLLYHHMRCWVKDLRSKDLVCIGFRLWMPAYLAKWEESLSLALVAGLVMVFSMEPTLRCLQYVDHDRFLTEYCPESEGLHFAYSVICSCLVLLYFILMADLSVFSTRLSGYLLVCKRALPDVGLLLCAMAFFIVTFGLVITSLDAYGDLSSIPHSMLYLIKLSLGWDSNAEVGLIWTYVGIFGYLIVSITLLTMLVAQISYSYRSTYEDMLGHGRLERNRVVIDMLKHVPRQRWERFIAGLGLDECIEFGEGDVGLAGGVQFLEPASTHPTTSDTIQRFGGSTSPTVPWPEELVSAEVGPDRRVERVQKMMAKVMNRMGPGTSSTGNHSRSGGTGSVGSDNRSTSESE